MGIFSSFFTFCVVIVSVLGKKDDIIYTDMPKLMVLNGNLHFQMPLNKYVEFKTSAMTVNGVNLLPLLKQSQNATKILKSYEVFISQYNSRMDDFQNRLQNMQIGFINGTTNSSDPNAGLSLRITRLNRVIVRIRKSIRNLEILLQQDECASNPCKNGAVCIDMYNGFLCQCQNGWEGPTCDKDINECARFIGTDLGCQNGGTCQNLPGTYQCLCTNGWIGIHCNRKPTDCNSGSTEICGHGTCIPQNNEVGYKCLCDAGWTTDGTHQACSVDVDECKMNHPPCSTNPLVLCTNIPGSFVCQHCPPGYTGNGYYCADVNECELFNGGCSLLPFVECINTPGSSRCGPCPAGYQGDGKTCTYRGVCGVNNGGCHLLARCVDSPSISDTYVQCICPIGYGGSGVGPNGCVRTSPNLHPCSPNPCVHGSCVQNNSTQGFTCVCQGKYSGTFCERVEDPCSSSPCQNGGTCQNKRRSFICKCMNGFTGRLCQMERQACGGLFTQPNGTITYPPSDYSSTDTSNIISCAYTILVDQTKTIQINFTKFELAESPCNSQWLQVNDGRNSLAPSLGRFCGRTLPFNGTLKTTHNVVYFLLKSNGRGQKPSFTLNWQTINPDCGGEITAGSGLISSPGWPGNYPNNRDCTWRFMTSVEKRIVFHIYSLNIGDDSDCSGDQLTIYSAITSLSYLRHQNVLAKFCNSTFAPDPIRTPDIYAKINFKSNNKNTYSGFQIGYSTVDGIPGCGGTYTNPSGTIQSLEITDTMPHSMTCTYDIQLLENATINIEFLEVDLSENCDLIKVSIVQKVGQDMQLLDKLCGSTLPGIITAYGNNVQIIALYKQGFKANWKVKYNSVCSMVFTDPVKSFNTMSSSYSPRECLIRIEQPAGYIIIMDLEISLLNLPTLQEYVEVRDGHNENASLIARYDNVGSQGKKVKLESTTNYLWIKRQFNSRFSAFSFNYTTLNTGCGGVLKNKIGTISYPPHGQEKYSANKKCRWVIVAPPGNVIQLNWMTFDVEKSFDCTYDHVQVFDNNTDTGQGGSMGKFCGFTLPPVMLSSSNIMTIDFTSDSTVHGEGFLMSYNFVKENSVCGGHYFTPAGVIRSPGYPGNYPTMRECVWKITVPPGNQIMLNVVDFNVEAYSSCRYDWLEIRNGGTSASPLIGKYCGTAIPKEIPSHANQLYLKFTSDISRTAGGFKITWSSAATGCGGSLLSPTGSIMSPHYPEPYIKNTDCTWKITVSEGSKIQIIFADLDLEKHSSCGLDYVQLFDGPTINSKSLGKFCSPQTNAVISSSNKMLVRFRSDISFEGRGFNIQYSTVCKNTLTGFRGVIESPNFPNDYPQDQNCEWDIKVPDKNKINITFSHFALERSATLDNKACQFDYVEVKYQVNNGVYDPEETEYSVFGKYCGDTNPGLITLNSDHAKIHFVSDSLLLGTGFRLEWQLYGCGGELNEPYGTISSPNYPKPYPPSIHCHWVITAPLGNSIRLTFDFVDIEKEYSCVYDAVEIYNGKDDSYNMIASLCHQEKPTVVTSTGNTMLVKFKADYSAQGRGFTASYDTKPTTCGGLMTTSSGYIMSPNYPKNFNKNDTCEWSISIEENYRIELKFEDVDLVKNLDCNRNYVKVFDGPSQAYPVLARVCGDQKPNGTIKSTYEHMFVEFRSDSVMTSKGFKAKYRKACGAIIKATGSGVITLNKAFDYTGSTMNFNDNNEKQNCTYTIQAEDRSKHVTLAIKMMDKDYSWCDEGFEEGYYLRIYNGPFSDSPLIGKYCGGKVPPTIVSDGSALHIVVTETINFLATYTVLDNACGGDLISLEGYFASPNWPKSYPRQTQCEWTIAAAPGNKITVNFINFDIPDSEHCETDYLEIREMNSTGKLLGVYCGINSPRNISYIGQIYLLFKSSSLDDGVSSEKKGFYAEYETATTVELSGPYGQIGNPSYPRSFNAYNTYSWRIMTQPKTRIELTFKDFFMEKDPENDCTSSVFKIYDGVDDDAPLLKQLCGADLPDPVLSTSSMMYIVVDYFSTRLDSKFLVEWKEYAIYKYWKRGNETTNCGSVYTIEKQKNQTISSPGFPDGYASNINCEWIFEAEPQYHLQISFLAVDFGIWSNSRVCTYADKIKVFTKLTPNVEWKQIKEICNNSQSKHEIIEGGALLKVEFKTNKFLNGSGFQANVKAVCGAQMTEPSGYIILGKGNAEGKECEWNISVKAGRTIKLTFEEFDLTSIDNDCLTYLVVRNGKSSDSPLLGKGKFCKDDSPGELESTSNKVYLKYVGAVGVKGFKMKYQAVSVQCGGDFRLSSTENSTEISSPNYPNIPNPYTECIWTIRAPPGESLRIDFEDRFDIKSSIGCEKEYVELREGGTEWSPLIGKYCVKQPSTKFTSDNMLRVQYYTDLNVPSNGFKAKISIASCGGTIHDIAGTLDTTKLYGIQPGANCTWILKGPVYQVLELKFKKINLSGETLNSYNCSENDIAKVKIYEINEEISSSGGTISDLDLGTYCGMTVPNKTITAKRNVVAVQLLARSSNDGFVITYSGKLFDCSDNIVSESGTISSSNYPVARIPYCFWKVTVPKGRRITFYTEDVDIGNSYVTIFDHLSGPPIHSGSIALHETYETSSNIARIVLFKRMPSSFRRFTIKFSSDQPTACTGDFNQTSGVITAPQLKAYLCKWDHMNLNNQTLGIKIILQSNKTRISACKYSGTGVTLASQQSLREAAERAVFCLNTNNEPVTIRTPYLITHLEARKLIFDILNFTITYKTYKCGGIIRNEEGTISSPNYPNAPPDSMECAWAIQLNPEQRVKITVTSLDLGNDCSKSNLIIGSQYMEIGKYCGSNKPDVIITQTNKAKIQYKYEMGGDGSAKGFILNYEPVMHGCGGIMHDPRGAIETPDYGKMYPNNAECLWELHALDGNVIRVTFVERFHIEESTNCSKDYVEFFDWDGENWTSMGKKCGRNVPDPVISTGNKLRILFRSNDKVTAGGFMAKWDLHCGGQLRASSKEKFLTSPNYPSAYRALMNCTYKIVSKKKNGVVSVRFIDFALKDDENCNSDNLTISQSTINRFIAKEKYCGSTLPPPQRYRDSVTIIFKSDKRVWYNGRGFKLAYKDETCGGNISVPTAIEVLTPEPLRYGRMHLYQPRISCSWYVTAPHNQIPVLSIEQLEMSQGLNCLVQSLNIYNGFQTVPKNRLAQLCGKIERETPVSANSTTMLINLESSAFNFNGFKGDVYFTYGPEAGCGGTINLTDTTNINAPNGLPEMDCHWKIIAPTDYKVQIDFREIHIKGWCGNHPRKNFTHFCTCAYVEVRDGAGPFSDLMGKLCSSESERSFVTSWNTAYVRLYSGTMQNDAFRLTVKAVQSPCGPSQLTVTKDLKVLKSPNYPNSYPDDIKCTWILTNPDSTGKISLHFEDFSLNEEKDLQHTNECQNDKVEIIDDPNRHIITDGYGPTARHAGIPKFQHYRETYNRHAFCGQNEKPFDYYSVGNTLTISFDTYTHTKKGQGFKLQYTIAGCNRTINANEGRVQSDNKRDKSCIINVKADENRTLAIYFLAFSTPRSNDDCSGNAIEIHDGNATGPLLKRACGYKLPNPIFTNTNSFTIKEYTSPGIPNYAFARFDLLFISTKEGKGCGGKLYNYKGKFSSPMYPDNYRKDSECTWEVKVPAGNKVALKFTDFDIIGNCDKNKVVVTTYVRAVSTDHVFCPGANPAVLFSDLNIKVTYYSSNNNGGTGWLALFQAVTEESKSILWYF